MGSSASSHTTVRGGGAQYPPPNQQQSYQQGYQRQGHQQQGFQQSYQQQSYQQQPHGYGLPQQQQVLRQQQQQHSQQQQYQQSRQQATAPPANQNRPRITRRQLDRYVELEQQTRQQDNRAVVERLKQKKQQLEDLEQTLNQLKQHWRQCEQRTAKEKSDVDRMQHPSTRSYFQDQAQYNAQLTVEQEEYLEALSEQETAKKQVDGVERQKEQLKEEVTALSKEADTSFAIYREQDEILAAIFNGEYGSELENHLEAEYELLVDRKQRVSVARFKWHNARVLVHHACNQLAHACRKWLDLAKAPVNNTQLRYTLATETRNNLVACVTNVQNAQRYLSSIQFPYLVQHELDTLVKAYNNVYTDMATQDRHKHAYDCYITTHKRAAALIQWFDHVISQTIVRDLDKVSKELDRKYKELKRERERLIRELLVEQGQGELAAKLGGDDGAREEEGVQDVRDFVEADKVSTAGDDGPGAVVVSGGEDLEDAPTPLPLSDLAPAPSSDALFGNIEELKRQHAKDREEFERTQQLNRARMDQGLEEKLRQRRQRRALQHLE